jgi:hypothetical protein
LNRSQSRRILPLASRNRCWERGAARLEAIADVHLECPPGCRQQVRRFYGGLVGLSEKRDEAETPQDLCFGSRLLRLRIRVVADALASPNRRRALIRVPSLDHVTQALASEGLTFELQHGLSFCGRWVHVLDPAGNLIELKEEWPL